MLPVVLIVSIAVAPYIFAKTVCGEEILKIAYVIALIFPSGSLMGTAFPTGMREAFRVVPNYLPWFWGLNGVSSVAGGALAVSLSVEVGISRSFYAGILSYTAATIALLFIMNGRKRQEQ